MDFAFSDEQEMLREQARNFLADRFAGERVAELADSDAGWDEGSWKQMAELGWTGLSVPEEQGGSGMGFLEEAVLFEEFGRALYPGPFFSTVALALPALSGSSEDVARIASGELRATVAWAEPSGATALGDLDTIGTKAEQSNGSWTITGEKFLVPDLHAVDGIVVVARSSDGLGLFLVDASAAELAPLSTVDSTRRYGRLTLNGAAGKVIAEPGEAESVLGRMRLKALAALSLEAVGVAQTVLELAIEHAKERKQFDKPIGIYQAVSHKITDMFVETELARSLAYWAAWCVAEEDDQAEIAVAGAKAAAGEAAVGACERSIQAHGGIGFTWEHILHRYYKRAQWIDSFEGYSSAQRAAIVASILS